MVDVIMHYYIIKDASKQTYAQVNTKQEATKQIIHFHIIIFLLTCYFDGDAFIRRMYPFHTQNYRLRFVCSRPFLPPSDW